MTDGETVQTQFSNKRGWLNLSTRTWHHFESCAGFSGANREKRLPDAVADGDNLCGNCCSHFRWYDD